MTIRCIKSSYISKQKKYDNYNNLYIQKGRYSYFRHINRI